MSTKDSQVDLIFKLQGSAINEGINVFELSPLLLSVGELIQESNFITYPNGKKIGINVKPFKQGSFVVEILIFAQNNLQQLLDNINQDNVKQIKELLEWIGIIGTGTGGVIGIYKFLKGQPKRIEVGPDEVKITAKDDNSITVNKKSFLLFQNTKVQQSIYNIYGNFLGKEGVDSVNSYLKENESSCVEVTKADVSHFNPANTIPLEGDGGDQKNNITQCFLKPKRLSVEGEPDNWSFRKGGDTVITATIKDVDFLNKVRSGEIRLSKEDLLEVNLLESQTIKDQEIITKYEVLQILDYKPSPVQQGML